MLSSQKIALIGGTGKSGKYLLSELLQRGHAIRMLHRHPGQLTLQHPLLEIVKGDARDPGSIQQLLQSCTAVVSTLGQPANEPTIFSQATDNVLNAMAAHHINRYIVTTGLSVDSEQDDKSDWVKTATDWMKNNYPETTADKQKEYQLLCESRILWTLIRLPLIVLTEEKTGIHSSLEDCPGEKVNAADLAVFIADQLHAAIYYRAAPFIASK